jgi:ATP-dependent Lon protease
MNDISLDLNVIYGIINLQRIFRIKSESVKKMNKSIILYNEILISMANNVTKNYNNKLYTNQSDTYKKIIHKLENIKKELENINSPITIKNSHENGGISKISMQIVYLNQLITNLFKLLAPDNINYILKTLVDDDWIYNFNSGDLEELLFYFKMFVPTKIYDTSIHSKIMIKDKDAVDEKKKKSSQNKKSDEEKNTDDSDSNDANGQLDDFLSNPFGSKDNSLPLIFVNDDKSKKKNKNKLGPLTRSISDLLKDRSKSKSKKKISPHTKEELSFDKCKEILGDKKLVVVKNTYADNVIEEKCGAKIYLLFNNKAIVLYGYFKDDLINVAYTQGFLKEKYKSLKLVLNYNMLLVPSYFKDKFMKQLTLRDFIVLENDEISSEIKRKYNDYKNLQGKPLLVLVNEFVLASKYRKIDILTLLLMSNIENKKLAYVLFDILQTKDQANIAEEIYLGLHHSIRDELDAAKLDFKESEKKIRKLTESDIPYEKRITLMDVEDDVKGKAMEKLKSIKSSFQGDGKAQSYLDGLLKIPFNIFKECPVINFKSDFSKKLKEIYPIGEFNSEHQINEFITDIENKDSDNQFVKEWREYQMDTKEYIRDARKSLDAAVYGHKEAKTQLERIIGQWINGEAKGAVLGLEGPPGTGKTSLAKQGLSKCLTDENGEPRPFAFLPIGGSTNGSTLVGHNYTYVGSTWGRIVDILMTTKCMNPIIFIDEIDKVSHTEHGKEIISILTHLTDSTQNDEFEDKYFAGIKFDLSKALIVLSFNDVNLIDPILKDRITIIQTNALSTNEKIRIVKDYMLPEILKDVGFTKEEIIIDEEEIIDIIETYTYEAGVRKLKEKLYELVREINLLNIYHNNITFPYHVKNKFIKRVFENKPKVRVKKIADKPYVGLVNGLYASTSGIGGLTIIECYKQPSERMLDLSMTGSQGDVMKESVQVAKTIAWSLLDSKKKDEYTSEESKKKPFGIHIHTPEGAVPKDGPSAGAAMTLAIYSLLSGIPVKNNVAMTGEIDLSRNVRAIGGLSAKLNGARRAGATLALIPKENEDDLDRIRREKLVEEDEHFRVIMVETIHDVFKHALYREDENEVKKENSLEDLLNIDKEETNKDEEEVLLLDMEVNSDSDSN